MFSISHVDYNPVLRGKQGELDALSRLHEPTKVMIAPTIVLPPIAKNDQLKKRPLSPSEATHIHVGRIADAWGKLPLFIDMRFLRFSLDESDDANYFKTFLKLSEIANCKAIPVISFRVSPARLNVIRDYNSRTGSGVAVRLTISDLDKQDLDTRIRQLLENVGSNFEDAMLQLDLSETDIFDIQGFAELLSNLYSRVSDFGPWAKVSMAASNYPVSNPAQPNGIATVQRAEWLAWKIAANSDERIKRSIYSDYGADHGKIIFLDSGAMATPHFRYALSDTWLVSRGGETSSLIDGTIRGAASRIAASKFFAGEKASWGDQFISDCANNLGRPGSAKDWRAANMNRHMTNAVIDLGNFIGHEVSKPKERYSALQMALPLKIGN